MRYLIIMMTMLFLAIVSKADTHQNSLGSTGQEIEKNLVKQSSKKNLTPQQQSVKSYFELQVFPRVPEAMRQLKANPICPGPCCPSTDNKGFNDPTNHAEQIAYQLLRKQYCDPKK